MNNSNECNGNHAMLVILFSVACPSAPPPNPPHHCKSRKTSSKSSAMFLISQLLYLCTIPSQKGGISDRAGTLIDPPQPCFISAPTHTHTHLACTVCFLAILFSPVCADSARGYTNWSGGVVSRWHRSTSSIATFAPAPPSQTSS